MSSTKKASKNASHIALVSSLQQLEGGFLFLVNQAPIIVTIIDKKGFIIYQSPNIKKILGYEAGFRIGGDFIHSSIVHPDDTIIKDQLLKKTFKYPNQNFTEEVRVRHKNGSWLWMQTIYNNQLNNPDVRGVVVISQDINERKLLELQKNEFLSIASHELKTPLTSIRAYGQLLIKRHRAEEKKEQDLKFLNNIVSQTDKLTGLIDDLLDVSKLQEGKFSVQYDSFQMKTLVKKLIEDFTYMSDQHTIILKKSTVAFVKGDESRIAQVLMNLLTNSIKHSPSSTQIEIAIEKKGKFVVTSVKDFGEGIPADKQKFVFDRFFRIDDVRTRPTSTGLGLYIASEIIKLHEGKIWLESKKGKGATFYFSLPIAKST